MGLGCNGGVVLAGDVVLSGDGTLVSWDELNVAGVMAKVLELEDGSSMIKPRLVSLLLIKPIGLPVEVSLPVGSSSWSANLGSADIILRSIPSPMPIVQG